MLKINIKWKYKDIMENIDTLRAEYRHKLTCFSVFQRREAIKFKREVKNQVYSLQILEYQKNRIWEKLNDFVSLENLQNKK